MYVILNKRPDRNGFVKISLSQGDFYCGASSQADIIRNYFLKFPRISSFFFKIPLKFSISSQLGWQAGTDNVALVVSIPVKEIKLDLTWKEKVIEVLEKFLREKISAPPATMKIDWSGRVWKKVQELSGQIKATRGLA